MKPERIIHISSGRRRDGNPGGVEKFAWYLERAIGAELLVDSQYQGQLLPKTLFIVDGGHGLNIPNAVPILSVCHGTWVAVWQRWQFIPEPIDHPKPPYESTQVKMWGVPGRSQYPKVEKKPNVLPVACSSGAKRELICYHGRDDSPVLLHGIDHDEYVPRKTLNEKPTIIHVATEWRKGQHLISKISEKLPQFNFQFLNAKIGEEPVKFAQGDMFIHLSCSEGNSYACLEAMSCNLPMVVTNVGLFESDVQSETVGKVIPYYSTIDQMVEAIVEVWESRIKYNPREWIIQNATFQHFKERWLNLISNAESFNLTLV